MKKHTHGSMEFWTGRHTELGLVIYTGNKNLKSEVVYLFVVSSGAWLTKDIYSARKNIVECSDAEHETACKSYLSFWQLEKERRAKAELEHKALSTQRPDEATTSNPAAQYDDRRLNDILAHHKNNSSNSEPIEHQNTGGVVDSGGENYDYTAIK